MFEKLSIAIKEDEELNERLKTTITQHLQSLETVFEPGMWKSKRQKLQIFVEAEAGIGKRVPLPLWPLISNVKSFIVVQFFVKYTTKSECFIDHDLQRNIFKGLSFI